MLQYFAFTQSDCIHLWFVWCGFRSQQQGAVAQAWKSARI